jgi:hypothetical protein
MALTLNLFRRFKGKDAGREGLSFIPHDHGR